MENFSTAMTKTQHENWLSLVEADIQRYLPPVVLANLPGHIYANLIEIWDPETRTAVDDILFPTMVMLTRKVERWMAKVDHELMN